MSEVQAQNTLTTSWATQGVLIRDAERTWSEDPAKLGLWLDVLASSQAAYDWGRSDGGPLAALQALFGGAEVAPQLTVEWSVAAARLEEIRPLVDIPAKNAGIQLSNGQVQPVPPEQGRLLDTQATLAALQSDPAAELADGYLDLVMTAVAPAVTDATPLLQEAQSLLTRPFSIEAYDPINDQTQQWSLSPDQWGQWLVAVQDPNSPSGLSFSLDQAGLSAYLSQQNSQLAAPQYLKVEETLPQMNQALANRTLNAWIRIYHGTSTYTVQAGDSIASIGYDLGIPYPWIQAANPGLGPLNPGQQINIPSKDDLLPLPLVRTKRIVVSISQQRMWAYENGQLKWEWVVSTGISRSPTSPGIFQIQSHEVNAYASQWNLYMPHFMGVYRPGPGADVMNGFHGFPTDANGGYLLWTNDLGRPATYGCILLSLENAQALYDWAEQGVVVAIQA
jgi:LysM repeat protein